MKKLWLLGSSLAIILTLVFACGDLVPSEEEATTTSDEGGDEPELGLRLSFDALDESVEKIIVYMIMPDGHEHKLDVFEVDDLDSDDPEVIFDVEDYEALQEDDGEFCLVITAWHADGGESEFSRQACIDLETRPES